MGSPLLLAHAVRSWSSLEVVLALINSEDESEMNATTVAVDLAKSVFQLAAADGHWRVIETHRLTRSQFERWFLKTATAIDQFACYWGSPYT